jgi:hypothetical protein
MLFNIPKKFDLARKKRVTFVCFLKYQAFIDVLAYLNNKNPRRLKGRGFGSSWFLVPRSWLAAGALPT